MTKTNNVSINSLEAAARIIDLYKKHINNPQLHKNFLDLSFSH